ncbi:MAG TPA: septum formation initiator family protein [Vicinamibacterales bacterium]|jgi:cell division protein FtsB
MPATLPIVRRRLPRPDAPEPLRRRRAAVRVSSSPFWRRALNYLLVFAVVVLFVDALVGERGLLATTRAQRTADELNGRVETLREENRRLRETARRLKDDATTIELVAREELGLIRPGEILVVVKDLKTP